jgi:transposase InsO family protein
MVKGLPQFRASQKACKDCLVKRQHCDPFPNKSIWKASNILQLVHINICGPINPICNSKKRYLLTFIDDFNIKFWVYFLVEKSEAFDSFKFYKARLEKETRTFIQSLKTDRGREFISQEFKKFCNTNGIHRQLIVAYTPQQNGIAKKKNHIIINVMF